MISNDRKKNGRVCEFGRLCNLNGKIVRGDGQWDNPLAFLVGEAPGYDEFISGYPFVGKSGQELDMYLRRFAKISRERCWVDNLVRCRPKRNKDPKVAVVAYCTDHWLRKTVLEIRPEIIVSVGRLSTQWFTGTKENMEKLHGIPLHGQLDDHEFTLLPIYHPASGLHSTHMMRFIINDFQALGQLVRGQIEPRQPNKQAVDYRLVEVADE